MKRALGLLLLLAAVSAQAQFKPLIMKGGRITQAGAGDTVALAGPTTVTNSGSATTDSTVTTGTANTQCWRQAANPYVGTGNEQCGFFSLNVPSGHGGGVAYEAEPLYTRCVTADSNTGGLGAYDCVGAELQATTSGTGQLIRIWGADATTRVVSGSDGYVTGFENDIYNAGTSQSALNTATSKHNFLGVCRGPNNCTSLMDMNAVGGSTYYHGIPIIKQYMNSSNADVFSVVDGSVGGLPNIAAIYADGHTLTLGNSIVTGAAASNRVVSFETGANDSSLSLRWNIGANNTAESGSNAGSDYQICAYSDVGAYLSCPLVITRSSGAVQVPQISVSGTAFANSASITNLVLASSTVSALPACTSSTNGYLRYVSDATAPAYNGTLTGGGTVRVLALCNGTAWTAH